MLTVQPIGSDYDSLTDLYYRRTYIILNQIIMSINLNVAYWEQYTSKAEVPKLLMCKHIYS